MTAHFKRLVIVFCSAADSDVSSARSQTMNFIKKYGLVCVKNLDYTDFTVGYENPAQEYIYTTINIF